MNNFLNEISTVAVPFLLAIIIYFAKKQDAKLERVLYQIEDFKVDISLLKSEKNNTAEKCKAHNVTIDDHTRTLYNHELRIVKIENNG